MNIKVIHKFPLANVRNQYVRMPKGAELLTVQKQNDELKLWALVDEKPTETENRSIFISGTGSPIRPDIKYKYLATVQLHCGEIVLHVFEAPWGGQYEEL